LVRNVSVHVVSFSGERKFQRGTHLVVGPAVAPEYRKELSPFRTRVYRSGRGNMVTASAENGYPFRIVRGTGKRRPVPSVCVTIPDDEIGVPRTGASGLDVRKRADSAGCGNYLIAMPLVEASRSKFARCPDIAR
jgi:hypothetical protein